MPAAATSPYQTPPVPPPPQMPPRQPNFFKRVEDFWHRVTEGLELQQLWSQFQTEARTGYRLYSRDVEARGQQPQPGRHKWLHTAGEFFWAVLMKLSPAKRVILLVALVLLMLGALDFTVNDTRVSFDARTFGGLLILLILVLETADRVIMKRDLEIAKEIQRWLVPSEAPEDRKS